MSKTEDEMYNSQNCTLEGQKPEWCTQHRGIIYEVELVLKENKDVM